MRDKIYSFEEESLAVLNEMISWCDLRIAFKNSFSEANKFYKIFEYDVESNQTIYVQTFSLSILGRCDL